MHFLKSHRSTLLTLFSVLAAAFAAPYLVPGDPDAQVFRNGVLPALLLLAAAYPVHAAFEKHPARALKYGLFLGLVFTFFLGVGSELMFYDQLLPGMGSLIRRFAVPCMATPLVGALFSHLFALPRRAPGASRRQLPYLFYFLVFALSYGATLLAFFPGIINYDFEGEIVQYLTGEYLASHPIFHTVLTGVLYRLGTLVFGSATGGAATYSVFQLLCLSAMFAWCCCFLQKRVPLWATLLLTAAMAILPYNGVLAISTIKDTLFTGLCAMLCLTLWEIAESPEAFLSRKRNLARLFGICLTMSLLRHNAVFATLPALLVVILLCRNGRKKAVAACAVTLLFCLAAPRCLQYATHAKALLSSELMSVPCQQLMRTASRATDLTEEEYDEISAWFSDAIHRYRPSYADPAKGGNFDLERYNEHPEAYWSMYLKYAKRYPRIYAEAFLANCMGIWYPDDTTHAHTMDSEEWDFVYLKTGNIVPEIVGEVNAHSYLPAYHTWIYNSMHHSRHENVPLYAQLFKPSTYVYLMLALTLLLRYRREKKFALCTLPTWGIIFSLLFSACILVRYSYPFMTCAPMFLLLVLFSDRRAA
jgi:hypothetical protein